MLGHFSFLAVLVGFNLEVPPLGVKSGMKRNSLLKIFTLELHFFLTRSTRVGKMKAKEQSQ